MYDLIIIGGGPAGMTAGVYAARKKLNAALISEDVGGQTNWTSGVENYMGYQFIEGAELMQKFEEQLRQFPLDMKTGERIDNLITVSHSHLEAMSMKGIRYQAKAAIIATGKRPRLLGVPGEQRLRARGVTYCAICDGPLFAGMNVAVVGGGNSALEAVHDMIRIARQVYLVSLTPLTADAILIDKLKDAGNLTMLLEHKVVEITGDSFVDGMKVRDLRSREERRLDISGVFVEIGLIPNSELVKGIVTLNAIGEIEINCANETGVPGLFAAGDVTNVPEKQIIVAAGEGAKAALQAHRYLQML